MKFEEALPLLKDGKKIRRKFWYSKEYIKISSLSYWGKVVDEGYNDYSFTVADLTKDDWEIMEDE